VNPLLKAALIGTSHSPDRAPRAESAIDGLVEAAATDGPERALLLRAGCSAVYRQAGHSAPALERQLPDRAAAETRPACRDPVASILRDLLANDRADLLSEAARRLDRAGQRLPHDLLPAVLEVRADEAREMLRPLLGERGRWLSQHRAAWKWAREKSIPAGVLPAEVERIWEEGSFEDRREALGRMRSVESGRARDRLREIWPKEKADQRLAFLSTFATGLSPEDEEFLESALDDRSLTVRRQSAELLARLPNSALSARMRARADAMLSFEAPQEPTGLWSKVRSAVGGKPAAKLSVEPPQEISKSWERDGISSKPPAGVGARAFWLVETLTFVSPTRWEERSGVAPQEIIAAARKGDWGEALVEGWSRAALAFEAEAWVAPLWDALSDLPDREKSTPASRRELLSALLRRMPPSEAEARIASLLNERAASEKVSVIDLLKGLRKPWGAALSETWIAGARRMAATLSRRGDPGADVWLPSFECAALALAENLFAEALSPWPELDTVDGYRREWARHVAAFLDTLQIRKTLKEEIGQ
jgi:hypothetical protein